MSDSLVGQTLVGRYRIDEAVSEELLGRVYRCVDLQESRPVLAKVLHAHLVSDATRFARFIREVRATAMVKHVNTIELLDSGSEDQVHFVIMEYFPSHTLEDEMEGGPISIERAAHIAAQIASAIGVAHQESITHRALSFRNVLLLENTQGDFVKVRDFGLSKLERFDDGAETSNLTEAGVRVGNTAYMAPEYIDRDQFHPKGDLYALGCMIFHMVTGRPPYIGRAADVLSAHVLANVPAPSEVDETVPAWLDELVVQLLAKAPEDRPGAYNVVQLLEAGVGHSLAPPRLSDPEKKVVRAPAPVEEDDISDTYRTRRSIPIGAIVGGLALIGLLAVFGVVLAFTGMGVVMLLESSEPVLVAQPDPPVPRTIVVPGRPVDPDAPTPKPPVGPSPRPIVPTPPPVPTEPVEVPTGVKRTGIRVTANRRALVYINGAIKGYSPVELHLPPGQHSVEAVMPGDESTRQRQELRVKKGERPSVVFTF